MGGQVAFQPALRTDDRVMSHLAMALRGVWALSTNKGVHTLSPSHKYTQMHTSAPPPSYKSTHTRTHTRTSGVKSSGSMTGTLDPAGKYADLRRIRSYTRCPEAYHHSHTQRDMGISRNRLLISFSLKSTTRELHRSQNTERIDFIQLE